MKDAAFRILDRVILPAVKKHLQDGSVVVLIGATCTGKSDLATKALPTATLITGLNVVHQASGVMDSDLIGEELFGQIAPDDFIRSRNQALALGHQVVITGQMWQDVVPYLAALDENRYRVFDLNRVWEQYGRPYHVANPIPPAVLAN